MTLSDLERRIGRYFALFSRIRQLNLAAIYVKVVEDKPILSATEICLKESTFRQYIGP